MVFCYSSLDKQTKMRCNWSRKWQTIPVFLPEESYRQRRLADYSLRAIVHGVTKSDNLGLNSHK